MYLYGVGFSSFYILRELEDEYRKTEIILFFQLIFDNILYLVVP